MRKQKETRQKKKGSILFPLILIVIAVAVFSNMGGKKTDAKTTAQPATAATQAPTQAPTAEPTATPAPDFSKMTAEEAAKQLAAMTESDKIHVSGAEVEDGKDLHFTIDIDSKGKYVVMLACNKIQDICEAAKDCPAVGDMLFDFNYPTVDKYGNAQMKHGMDAVIKNETMKKINYEYFRTKGTYDALLESFDIYYIDPALFD